MRTHFRFATVVMTSAVLVSCAKDHPTESASRDVELAPAVRLAPPFRYAMSELPLPEFSTAGAALGINDAGWVVGWTDSIGGASGGRAATLWMPGAAPIRLRVNANAYTGAATDINAAGDIVGYYRIPGYYENIGMVWDSTGKQKRQFILAFTPAGLNDVDVVVGNVCSGWCVPQALPILGSLAPRLLCAGPLNFNIGNCPYGYPQSVNNTNETVGNYRSWTGTTPEQAIYWPAKGRPVDLAKTYIGSATPATATHINNKRNVSGSILDNGAMRPVVWNLATGVWTEFSSTAIGAATSISDNNRIVGTANLGLGDIAFTATSPADFGALQLLRRFISSSAADVNTCGTIVGAAISDAGLSVPAIWRVRGGPVCDTSASGP
jgi:uncharacterized membrane protein